MLRRFANAARQLGSSAGIIHSTFHLRKRLAAIAFLLRNNAADLFPGRVEKQSTVARVFDAMHNPSHVARNKTSKRLRNVRQRAPPAVRKNPRLEPELRLEDIPGEIEGLAEDVAALLRNLNEFPEFTDEALDTSISAFEVDLRVRASQN